MRLWNHSCQQAFPVIYASADGLEFYPLRRGQTGEGKLAQALTQRSTHCRRETKVGRETSSGESKAGGNTMALGPP
jgi:hypothetical protein